MQLRDLRIGMRVVVQSSKHGVCRFLGRTKFAGGEWVGVELDSAGGKHDGSVEGIRYFQCARPLHGIFVRASDVELEHVAETEEIAVTHPELLLDHGPPDHPRDEAAGKDRVPTPQRSAAVKPASPLRTPTRSSSRPSSSRSERKEDIENHSEPRDRFTSSDTLPAAAVASASHSPRSAPALSPSKRPSSASRHSRASSDLARIELADLLRRSSYLRDKPIIVQDLTKLLARRPSAQDMRRSGIMRDASTPIKAKPMNGTHATTNGVNDPTIAASSTAAVAAAASSSDPRLGWSAATTADADIAPPLRRLFVFGENTHGELSTGDESDCFLPQEIRLPPPRKGGAGSHPERGHESDFAQVCLGLHHMAVLTLKNEVLTCGSWIANLLGTDDRQNIHRLKRLRQFEDMRLANPTNPIISISCGDRHTVALHNDGTCESFGGTLHGKLGHRGSGASENDSKPTPDGHGPTYLSILALRGQKVSQMSAGNWHTLCVTTTGAVWSFGGGGKFYNQGQLGHGDTEDSMTPRRIETWGKSISASKIFVKNVVCGGTHSLALTNDRCVYSFGCGKFGQLGLGTDNNHTTPQLITSLLTKGAKSGRTIGIAAGENHSLVVQADGSVYSWGAGIQGQCGHGNSHNEKLPKRISYFSKRNIVIVQVDAGWRHSIALAENHSVYTFGHNDHGQLGLGDTKSHSLPQLVESLEGHRIKTVAAGGSHSLAFNDYFKAAQELVFLQRVRELKQRANSSNPTSPRNAEPTENGTSSPVVTPRRSMLNRQPSATPLAANPLVPLQLRSMLHEMNGDTEDTVADEEEQHEDDEAADDEIPEEEEEEEQRDEEEAHPADDDADVEELAQQAVQQLNEAFDSHSVQGEEAEEEEPQAEEEEVSPLADPDSHPYVDSPASPDPEPLPKAPVYSAESLDRMLAEEYAMHETVEENYEDTYQPYERSPQPQPLQQPEPTQSDDGTLYNPPDVVEEELHQQRAVSAYAPQSPQSRSPPSRMYSPHESPRTAASSYSYSQRTSQHVSRRSSSSARDVGTNSEGPQQYTGGYVLTPSRYASGRNSPSRSFLRDVASETEKKARRRRDDESETSDDDRHSRTKSRDRERDRDREKRERQLERKEREIEEREARERERERQLERKEREIEERERQEQREREREKERERERKEREREERKRELERLEREVRERERLEQEERELEEAYIRKQQRRLSSENSTSTSKRTSMNGSSSHSVSFHSSLSTTSMRTDLMIELVYSSQVHFTHRFITFQTRTDERRVRQMIDAYKTSTHGQRDVLLDQLQITPANTVVRTERQGVTTPYSPRSSRHDSHVYEYDSIGPPRYTLLFILSSVVLDENLWPDWAQHFYALLLDRCDDVMRAAVDLKQQSNARRVQHSNSMSSSASAATTSIASSSLLPCFRELRPTPATPLNHAYE